MNNFKEWLQLQEKTLEPGTKVKVPNAQGKIVTGKVIRYDDGKPDKSPFYIVYVGSNKSEKVPAHKIKSYESLEEGFGKI